MTYFIRTLVILNEPIFQNSQYFQYQTAFCLMLIFILFINRQHIPSIELIRKIQW